MHRTEGANNITNMFFNGPPGTRLEEDWLNSVQEELANVIEQAGLVLETAGTDSRQQLWDALTAVLLNLSTIRFAFRTSAPATPVAGDIVMADRVTWDPLGIGSGGAYLTMYLGAGSGWGAITGQLD